jgi:hypothetical protein
MIWMLQIEEYNLFLFVVFEISMNSQTFILQETKQGYSILDIPVFWFQGKK